MGIGKKAVELALQSVGVREDKNTPNWGRWIKVYLNFVGWFEPAPWCAAFVSYKVHQAAKALGVKTSWPKTASCQAIYNYAKRTGRLRTIPHAGYVFLLWNDALKRYAHTGFVTSATPDNQFGTVEGNTNEAGGREGYIVAEKERETSPKVIFVSIE